MTPRLRPVRQADEAAFLAAHREMAAEEFPFGLGLEADMTWPDYVHRLDSWRMGLELPPGYVSSTFLVAVAGDVLRRVERVLVTCDDDNIGSASVVERCGGALDSVVESTCGGPPIRRYWID